MVMQTSMRALIIDKEAKSSIRQLINHALERKIDFDTLQRIVNHKLPPVGNSPEYSCKLQDGFRVVFSIEQQPDKNWYRHISISINDRTKLPSVEAVQTIMTEFEFEGEITDCQLWIEKNSIPPAINLLQECHDTVTV
jgi:hypothetical protein